MSIKKYFVANLTNCIYKKKELILLVIINYVYKKQITKINCQVKVRINFMTYANK